MSSGAGSRDDLAEVETRPNQTQAVAPKRERGRVRVKAILDAAALVLAEKGFDGATMSEVAARSSTAIGSLYRFFPTKAALAEALAQRFVLSIGLLLECIERRAQAMGPDELAAALVGVMEEFAHDRAAVIALLDVSEDAEVRRSALRQHMLDGLGRILRAAAKKGCRDVQPAVPVVLHLMKGVSRMRKLSGAADQLDELQRALSLYLADVLG